jgi:hypothetical protein
VILLAPGGCAPPERETLMLIVTETRESGFLFDDARCSLTNLACYINCQPYCVAAANHGLKMDKLSLQHSARGSCTCDTFPVEAALKRTTELGNRGR